MLKYLYSEKRYLKIINELDVTNARIDIATIDKSYFCGYEIKSDKDTLKRLPIQIQIYGYVFDKITIVVGESKLSKVNKMIPNFWGIMVAKNKDGKIILIEERNPKLNENINKHWLAQKLWRSDITDILKAKNLYKGKSNYYKSNLLFILMENTSLDELKYYVRNVLINRVY